jgi:hypothetical protein
MFKSIKTIIRLEGNIKSTWIGKAKNGGTIYLAELFNSKDGERYVLTSPKPIALGNINVEVVKNASGASYSILDIPEETFERLNELSKLL